MGVISLSIFRGIGSGKLEQDMLSFSILLFLAEGKYYFISAENVYVNILTL